VSGSGGYPAFSIIASAVGGVPVDRSKQGSWGQRVAGWARFKTRGVCAYCLSEGEVYDVSHDPGAFGLGNFTDFSRRLAGDPFICLGCLTALKEDKLRSAGALVILTAGVRLPRGAKGSLAADGATVFDAKDPAHRREFLRRLLDDHPPQSFICGWKQQKSHALPWAPVNEPGARVVQVLYEPWYVKGGKKKEIGKYSVSVVYLDRVRHRGLIGEIEKHWGEGGGYWSDLLDAYSGSPLFDFLYRLLRP